MGLEQLHSNLDLVPGPIDPVGLMSEIQGPQFDLGKQSTLHKTSPTEPYTYQYGDSVESLKPTTYRSLQFGKGTAYDRPNGGFSNEPFIGKNIDIPGVDQVASSALGFIDSLSDGLVRGGIVTALSRSVKDAARLTKFFISSRGIGFLAKQVGLQRSNPRPESRSFNLLSIPAQALVNFAGMHVNRDGGGLLPIKPDSQTYGYIAKKSADIEGNIVNNKLPEDTNRLTTLFNSEINISSPSPAASQFITLVGQEAANLNIEIPSIVADLAGLDDGVLYDYNGGPDSLYGIGKTTIRRYDNTTDAFSKTFKHFKVGSGQDRGAQLMPHIPPKKEEWERPLNFTITDYINTIPLDKRRENRIGTGTPGVSSPDYLSPNRLDPYIRNKENGYNVFSEGKIDKINRMDILRTDKSWIEGADDLVNFRFESVDNDNPNEQDVMVFRAFLDNVDDSYNASHNTHKYNGRGEEFYTYNSFKRSISFSFKVAAQTRHEMMPIYRKLNYLAAQTAPEYKNGRIRTGFTRVTIGDWISRTPGIINNVGIKWNTNYPWEVATDSDEGGKDAHMLVLPHVLDVSVSFTPIHNFLPQNHPTDSPFILPHERDVHLNEGQKWYTTGVSNDFNTTQATLVEAKTIDHIDVPQPPMELIRP